MSLENRKFLTAKVAELYERFPYPHYPLLAKPRWQDGYLVSSQFASRLKGRAAPRTPRSPRILIAGSGEILPYIIRRWATAKAAVFAVDLSGRSLRRARIRCALQRGETHFHQEDIDVFLREARGRDWRFDHVEAFGMLHHLTGPAGTLKLLAESLEPTGTMRIMVYNAAARIWIHALQDFFVGLGLDPHKRDDLKAARALLRVFCKMSTRWESRCAGLGRGTLANDTRFADTFLHPLEQRSEIGEWLAWIDQAGLRAYGLFDRYAELDDLRNPLWVMPSERLLTERAKDLRFENNLEVFVEASRVEGAPGGECVPRVLFAKAPPSQWFTFAETKGLSLRQRRALWWLFLGHLIDGGLSHEALVDLELPLRSLQRLARIGAILPDQVRQDSELREMLLAPMAEAMEVPCLPAATALSVGRVRELLRGEGSAAAQEVGKRLTQGMLGRIEGV